VLATQRWWREERISYHGCRRKKTKHGPNMASYSDHRINVVWAGTDGRRAIWPRGAAPSRPGTAAHPHNARPSPSDGKLAFFIVFFREIKRARWC